METFEVYIIYSRAIDKFYIGETSNLEQRLIYHNSGEFMQSFTKQANDWKLFFSIRCNTRLQARKIEKHIKKMKSKKYILNLKKYNNISQNLLSKYT